MRACVQVNAEPIAVRPADREQKHPTAQYLLLPVSVSFERQSYIHPGPPSPPAAHEMSVSCNTSIRVYLDRLCCAGRALQVRLSVGLSPYECHNSRQAP
jgi:hypothetical protein